MAGRLIFIIYILELTFAHDALMAHPQTSQPAQPAKPVIEQSDLLLFQIVFPSEVMTLLAQLFKLMDTQVLWLFCWLCWSCKIRKMCFAGKMHTFGSAPRLEIRLKGVNPPSRRVKRKISMGLLS